MKKLAVLIGIITIMAILALSSCQIGKEKVPRVMPNKTTEMKDLTKDDILLLIDQDLINSSYVLVKGLKLGDSPEKAIALLGRPAGYESMEGGILNLRFQDPITNETALIVHFDNDNATRITVREGFNAELINNSRFNYTKEKVTRAFGKPDKAFDTSFLRMYEYHDHGFEVVFKGEKMIGYTFVPAKSE